jgi:DNA-binding SARP family transcriptional activator/DNA-binding beta-propeller fold protein YncE
MQNHRSWSGGRALIRRFKGGESARRRRPDQTSGREDTDDSSSVHDPSVLPGGVAPASRGFTAVNLLLLADFPTAVSVYSLVDFRLLGQLEIGQNGRIVELTRGRERALLALLLLNANRALSTDRLVEELWPDHPPEHAAKTLQVYVSRLRKTIGPERLKTTPTGYALEVTAEELDTAQFERLIADGRAALEAGDTGHALSLLREALTLWRGPALADFRFESFAQSEIRRLEELHAAARADSIEARMSRGDANGVTAELKELIDENPLWERPRQQLMLALYRNGRQADALELYRATRNLFAEQLGIEPSPELQHLQRAILTHDPDLQAPTPSPRRTLARRGGRRLLLGGALIAVAAAAALFTILVATGQDGGPLLATRNSLAVVDPKLNEVVAVMPLGGAPRGIAVGGGYIWTANADEGTVSQIDPRVLHVIRTVGVGARATALVEANGVMWVATGSDNSVVQIDARSGGVLGHARVSANPTASAFAIDATRRGIWVGSGDEIVKLDPSSGAAVSRWHYLGGVNDVGVESSAVWIASSHETLARFSPPERRLTAEVSLGVIPMALARGDHFVWVASTAHVDPGERAVRATYRAAVWKVDPVAARVIQTTQFGHELRHPPTLDIAVGSGAVWVTSYEEGTVARIDPHTAQILKTIKIGGHPSAVVVARNRLWVSVS